MGHIHNISMITCITQLFLCEILASYTNKNRYSHIQSL